MEEGSVKYYDDKFPKIHYFMEFTSTRSVEQKQAQMAFFNGLGICGAWIIQGLLNYDT